MEFHLSASPGPSNAVPNDAEALHVVTWNLGGLSVEKTLTLLYNMKRGGIHPFDADFVIFLQEVIMDPGKTQTEQCDIHLAAGKRDTEWRGTAIAHSSTVTHSQTKLLPCGISCMLLWRGQRFVGVSGHLPHHATVAQAATILDNWSVQLDGSFRGTLGWDANETFEAHDTADSLVSQGARGEYILNWLAERHLLLPEQQLEVPTHHPYNTRMAPRRLDYLHTKNLKSAGGKVLQQRDLASSDHEPVFISLPHVARQKPTQPRLKPWGVRRMRCSHTVEELLRRSQPGRQGDPLHHLTDIAVQITEPGRLLPKFRETQELKQARREALHQTPGGERRAMWKAINREHTRQLREWKQQMYSDTARGCWSG